MTLPPNVTWLQIAAWVVVAFFGALVAWAVLCSVYHFLKIVLGMIWSVLVIVVGAIIFWGSLASLISGAIGLVGGSDNPAAKLAFLAGGAFLQFFCSFIS